MAEELAHFQNFAKLKDTKIAFNDITVIAGKPGTGKSYVMKFMYALDVSPIESLTQSLEIFNKITSQRVEIKDGTLIFKYVPEEKEKALKKLEEQATHITTDKILKNILRSIFLSMEQIANNFKIETKTQIIEYKENLDIKSKESNKSNGDFNLEIGNVIFVETPLILEFKKFMKREEGKTPYHIESLLNILDTDYSFTDEEQDKLIKDFTEKSKKIIEGDIESSGDSFIFNKKDDKNYDIVNASSGTKSIGLLQYLVTNKALKKGSVLYWEEPEVHLHPSWQLKMVELFVELMNAGIKIVFSTHSPFMADYLNAISKRNNYRDRISFNVLDEKDGVVTNHILNDDNWDILQKELMDSFEDILWQYL